MSTLFRSTFSAISQSEVGMVIRFRGTKSATSNTVLRCPPDVIRLRFRHWCCGAGWTFVRWGLVVVAVKGR